MELLKIIETELLNMMETKFIILDTMGHNDPETCNDNEIRKWKYFYDNPRDYIL